MSLRHSEILGWFFAVDITIETELRMPFGDMPFAVCMPYRYSMTYLAVCPFDMLEDHH